MVLEKGKSAEVQTQCYKTVLKGEVFGVVKGIVFEMGKE